MDVVALTHAVAKGLGQPVGVGAFSHRFILLVIADVVRQLGTGIIFIGIKAHEALQLELVFGIEHMIRIQVGQLKAQTSLHLHTQLAFFGAFRDNHDDAVGTSRTVDSRCRGIFQNVDRLNLIVVVVHQLLQ